MALKSRIVTFSFSRSLSFTLCLTLILSGVPLPARTQSQPVQDGVRTQGAPSPNAPNIDAIRLQSTQKQPDIKPPAPIRATRCRHHDKKCQQLKERKAENRFAPNNKFKGLLAYNRHTDDLSFDWRADRAGLLPELDFLFNNSRNDVSDSIVANETHTDEANRQHLPHAFASSLIPMAAVQATNFETARVEPHYRTGSAGEDLFSGNYH
jgi:hypothetical protein